MAITPIPNNIGPTFLLMIGLPTAPVGIGLPLILLALALLRNSDSSHAFPKLANGWLGLKSSFSIHTIKLIKW